MTNAEMEKVLTRREKSVAIRKQIQLLSVSFAAEEKDKHLCRLSGKEYGIETLKENFSEPAKDIQKVSLQSVQHPWWKHRGIGWKEDGTDPVIWTGKIMCINLRRRLLQVDIELLFPLSIRYKCKMT